MAEIKSFPNNQDEYVGAEYLMRWFHGRTSGVFGAEGNCAVEVVDGGMSVHVTDGTGWLANANADGIVWWVDSTVQTGVPLALTLDLADGVLPRIDRVVVTWETTNYVARPDVSILKGTPASAPVAPALTNTTTQRQISLAAILVPAGTVELTQSMITDERLDPSVCGIVNETISIDTSMIDKQFESLLADIEATVGAAGDRYNEFLSFIENLRRNANAEYLSLVNYYANLRAQGDALLAGLESETREELDDFKETEEARFNIWFDSVQSQLSDDVAGNLLNQINTLDDKSDGFIPKTTAFSANGKTITETFGNKRIVTELISTSQIIQKLYEDNILTKTKTISFSDDGMTIKEVVA